MVYDKGHLLACQFAVLALRLIGYQWAEMVNENIVLHKMINGQLVAHQLKAWRPAKLEDVKDVRF